MTNVIVNPATNGATAHVSPNAPAVTNTLARGPAMPVAQALPAVANIPLVLVQVGIHGMVEVARKRL